MNARPDTRRRPAALLAGWLLLAASAPAATYVVAPGGSDQNDGLSTSTPFRTVARGAAALHAGDTLQLRQGVYREYVVLRQAGSHDAPVRVEAYPGEQPVMSGSEVVTNWVHVTNAIWKAEDWPMTPQRVFEDGAPMRMVDWPNAYMRQYANYFYTPTNFGVAGLTNGCFYHDLTNGALYVWRRDGGSPQDALMEVAVRPQVLACATAPAHLAVSGLIFEHANSFTYSPGGWQAVRLEGPSVISNCAVRWNDAEGLSMRLDVQVLNSDISQNGMVGLGFLSNALVRGCTIISNNNRGFNPFHHAGGMKIHPGACPARSAADGVVEDCEIAWNRGYGVWFDYATSTARRIVRGNYVHDNEAAGIFLEVTRGGDVYNNVVVSNRGGGLHVSHASATRIWNNTFVGNSGFVDVYYIVTPRVECDFTTNLLWARVESNEFFNNIIYDSHCTYDLVIPANIQQSNLVSWANRSDYNLFWRPGEAPKLHQSGIGTWTSVISFAAATGSDSNSLSADPMLDAAGALWRAGATSPALDAGRAPTVNFASDRPGTPRPLDGNHDGAAAWDLGAYERVDPLSDTDGDGVRDRAELDAGTDPLDTNSVLRLWPNPDAVLDAGASPVVQWASASSRYYEVFLSEALPTGFGSLVRHLPSVTPANSYTTTPGPAAFFAIGLDTPP